jgi:lysophospholipase L1-like esterase
MNSPNPVRVAGTVGGGLALLSLGFVVGSRQLLRVQAAKARAIIGKPHGDQAIDSDRTWKKRYGDPVDLLVLGDSIAAGLGAEKPKETLGGRLSRGLATRSMRAVRLRTVAVVGAETSQLAGQLDRLPPSYTADVAVIVVGGNDVTHRVPLAESVRDLEAAITRLRERGTAVVVGTCPDLGMLRPVPQPLRSLGSRASKQLANAQRQAAVRTGAHVVSLAHVVGPFFITNPEEMFSLDRFHPSALGYKRTAKAMLPSVLAALGIHDRVPFGHTLPGLPIGG